MDNSVTTSVSLTRKATVEKIFQKRNAKGLWKLLTPGEKYYPQYQHYVPNFTASLWVLIYLADLQCDPDDDRIHLPFETIKSHFFDANAGIYTLGKDHFPIPCLNGNLLYLDAYFNGFGDTRSEKVLQFFAKYQRFDDGKYVEPKNQFCSNKSCYGAHTCYWGIVKLMKGLSFVPAEKRSKEAKLLLERCIDFILLHKVCFSSRKPDRLMVNKMNLLTFPNMYRADFLEILWLLKREEVQSLKMAAALDMLASKRDGEGNWPLERADRNLIVSAGAAGKANVFVTARAKDVLGLLE
jgi:hypothetical protein